MGGDAISINLLLAVAVARNVENAPNHVIAFPPSPDQLEFEAIEKHDSISIHLRLSLLRKHPTTIHRFYNLAGTRIRR